MVKKLIFFMLALFFCSGCSGFWNIGSSSFTCPHKRPSSQIRCMPASVIEMLDRQGKFDWRWHPICPKNIKNCEEEFLKFLKEKKSKVIIKGTVIPENLH